ncbi:B12-binding domain-containing protein [Rhodohalobacter sp.]|uniref:B12-binding domain-containing protein n=1 Tax=Rhodohalobacter sp. TaxID=1974210 RepID=UPI002ACE2E41|nr:B12-binding domain-containing protein [Rhodohalobacter sp.]MDZ7755428.1 cobalamin-dependent protein [Rhodohalobacter sp.]
MMNNPKELFIRKLQSKKDELAVKITELHFKHHPELDKKYGEQGREKCREDAVYHLNYLIEALQIDSPELFHHYLEWAYNMLEARNIPIDDLVENIRYIRDVISGEFSADEAKMAISFLESGAEHLEKLEPEKESFLLPDQPLSNEALQYLNFLLSGNRDQAAQIIDQLVEKGTPVVDIYEHIFQATQYEVGALWQRNEITVAHEHYCTAATQLIMSRLYPQIFSGEKNGLKLIACSVASELHEIGIRMVSDFFEMDGWDTYYMGSNMPEAHLLESLREHDANLLAISVTLPIHISRVESIIRNVRDLPEFKDLKIMAGGYPFGIVPNLTEKVGADATAINARQAISKANAMVS